MPKKPGVSENQKVRESVLAKATLEDLQDFSNYLNGKWKETFLPRVVRLWDVDVDEQCERMAFNGPLLNIHSLANGLEKEKSFRVAKDKMGNYDCVLIFYEGVKGDHPKGAAGVATSDSVELSTSMPAQVRKRLFSLLPGHLIA